MNGHVFQIRLNAEQRARGCASAEANGLTLSEWLRRAADDFVGKRLVIVSGETQPIIPVEAPRPVAPAKTLPRAAVSERSVVTRFKGGKT